MKLKISGFEERIDFDETRIATVVIENKKLYNKVLEDLNNKINSIESEGIYLYNEDYEELDMSKEMVIVFDLFNIEFNSKKILNKVYDLIASNIKKERDTTFNKIELEMKNYLLSEINELPFEFKMTDELDITQVLKTFELKIDTQMYNSVLEKLEFLIDLLANLEVANILVLPNLNLYLNEDQMLELFKYSLYNNVRLLIIEANFDREKNEYEMIYQIDNEFDEFIS